VTTLLQIIATPHQGGDSHTRQLAERFLDSWQTVNPTGTVETLDLARVELPPLDHAMVSVLFNQPPLAPPDLVARRRKALDKLVCQFTAADTYLFVTPMWNFGLPHTLKHYFDLVIRPAYTFALSPEGAIGLLGGRTAYALITRGFDYGPGSGHADQNFLEPHLRALLGFMGITDVTTVAAEGMMLPGAEERLEEAMRSAAALGLGLVAA
jgi:FMN-dependent NADH-azoreductase